MLEQFVELLGTVLEADTLLRGQAGALEENKQLLEDLDTLLQKLASMLEENGLTAALPDMAAYRAALEKGEDPEELAEWVAGVGRMLSPPPNAVDARFEALMSRVKGLEATTLVKEMKQSYISLKARIPEATLKGMVALTSFLAGEFAPEANRFTAFENRAACLKDHWEDLVWFYNHLGDYRSKALLGGILQYWMDLNYMPVNQLREYLYDSYFDLDLVRCSPLEVFVDLGAYVGDTALSYLETYGRDCYRKIYCYEIVKENADEIKRQLADYDDIVVRLAGAGAKKGTMYLSSNSDIKGNPDAMSLKTGGRKPVDVVALDDDIEEPITFLKMDIEGSEYDALLGARRHIREDRPKLAVCLYHSVDDLWRLPRLIYSICPDYDFYFRLHGTSKMVDSLVSLPTDYVLYCIPRG